METPRSHPHAVLAAEPRDVLPRRETSRGGAFPRVVSEEAESPCSDRDGDRGLRREPGLMRPARDRITLPCGKRFPIQSAADGRHLASGGARRVTHGGSTGRF